MKSFISLFFVFLVLFLLIFVRPEKSPIPQNLFQAVETANLHYLKCHIKSVVPLEIYNSQGRTLLTHTITYPGITLREEKKIIR